MLAHRPLSLRSKPVNRHGKRGSSPTSRQHAQHEQHRTSTLTCSLSPSVLSRNEFEICRSTLRTVLRRCDGLQVAHLSVVLTCLLTCLKPLDATEILVILRLSTPNTIVTEQESQDNYLEQLLRKCKELIFINFERVVQFAHPMLQQFVQVCPLRGIDKTHTTLTIACVKQLECMPTQIDHQTEDLGFVTYAKTYWLEHYQKIQTVTHHLTRRVHHLLSCNPHLQTSTHSRRSEVDADYQFAESGGVIQNSEDLRRLSVASQRSRSGLRYSEELVRSSMHIADARMDYSVPTDDSESSEVSDCDIYDWEIVEQPQAAQREHRYQSIDLP